VSRLGSTLARPIERRVNQGKPPVLVRASLLAVLAALLIRPGTAEPEPLRLLGVSARPNALQGRCSPIRPSSGRWFLETRKRLLTWVLLGAWRMAARPSLLCAWCGATG
jgi:hypothetical protein